MKKITKHLNILVVSLLFTGLSCMAQGSAAPAPAMKTFVIERNIPGAGQFSQEKLKSIAETSCGVLKEMGPSIQWLQSYVTEDKIICVYKAENIDLIREHAKKGGFPANTIYEISSTISPATAK
jgi:hypothetical protein